MRIDELGADEFMCAVAGIAEGVAQVKDSESGRAFMDEFAQWRGSLKDVPEAERNAKAGEWVMGALLKHLPAFCRENGDAVYAVLGACDGQTAGEYKACFTPSKLIADVKALAAYVGGNLGEVQSFLAQ